MLSSWHFNSNLIILYYPISMSIMEQKTYHINIGIGIIYGFPYCAIHTLIKVGISDYSCDVIFFF